MKSIFKSGLYITLFVMLLFSSCGKDEVTGVKLNKSSVAISVGQIDSLIAAISSTGDVSDLTLQWSSSDESVVKVTGGSIQGVSVGNASITVTAGKKTASCEVAVRDVYPVLTKGEIDFFGDVYESDLSNNITIYLVDENINLEDLSGAGEVLMLEVNIPLAVTDSLPTGEYKMMTDLDKTNLIPFSAVPGYFNSDNYRFGCWYYGNITSQISIGSIKVKKSNNIYTIDYLLHDTFGAMISGTFIGKMNFYNVSSMASIPQNKVKTESASANRKSLKFKGIKAF